MNHFVEVEDLWLQHLAAAEREELGGDRGGALGGGPDLLDIAPRFAAEIVAAQKKVGGPQDDRHLVIRFVRDATRQLSHNLQPLTLPDLFLGLTSRSDIGRDLDDRHRFPLLVATKNPMAGDVKPAPVLRDVHQLPFPLLVR